MKQPGLGGTASCVVRGIGGRRRGHRSGGPVPVAQSLLSLQAMPTRSCALMMVSSAVPTSPALTPSWAAVRGPADGDLRAGQIQTPRPRRCWPGSVVLDILNVFFLQIFTQDDR